MSKYGVFFGLYFPVFGLNTEIFGPNTGKYGPEKTPYLDTFHAVSVSKFSVNFCQQQRESTTLKEVNIYLRINNINKAPEEMYVLLMSYKRVVYAQVRWCEHWVYLTYPRTETYSELS